jgi:chitodextrinase
LTSWLPRAALTAVACTFALALTLTLTDTPRAAAATDGLVAAYAFDEGSGSTVADVSGNGNDGTTRNTAWTTGKYGSALSFNGRDSWVTVPSSASLALSGKMTLEAWVRPASADEWRDVIVKETSDDISYGLFANSKSSTPAGIVNNGTERIAYGTSKLPLAAWTFLAATYDGGAVRLYVNGTLASTFAATGSMLQSGQPLRIGGDAIWGEWFDGTIDQIRVYDRSLSQSELQADQNTAISPSAPPADEQAPAAPTGLKATASGTTGLALSWSASSDNVAVAGYAVYVNGSRTATTTSTTTSVGSLGCGTSYKVAVDAYDAAGNRSAQTTVSATTGACGGVTDTTAPSVPSGMTLTPAQTTIAMAWNASSDNVGVTAYNAYLNGKKVGSTTKTSYSYTGLTCGTTYTIGLTASDAAGNQSDVRYAQGPSTTTACASGVVSGGGSAGSVFVSPGGSDAASCSSAAPCRSFNRAYRVAQPGQQVSVAAGSYAGETIAYDSAKAGASQRVVIAPAAGAAVTVTGTLTVLAQHLELRDMTVRSIYAGVNGSNVAQAQQAADLVFRNLVLSGLIGRGVQGLLWTGGSVGGVTNAAAGAVQISDCYQCSYPAQQITIDGVYFHDVVRDQAGYDQGIHTECLHLWGGIAYVTVRNSRFYNCAIMDMFVENYATGSSGNVHDITVENNFFDVPGSHGGQYSRSGSALMFETQNRGNINNVTVRFNSFLGQLVFSENGGTLVNTSAVGNYGVLTGCTGTQASWSYNVWTAASCGTTDKKAAFQVKNPDSGDLHLSTGSAAINAVPTSTTAPTTDIDGNPRPNGPANDAGADEAN